MRLQYAPANQNKSALKGEKDLSAETMVAVTEMTEGAAETGMIIDVITAGMTVEGATGEGRKTMTDMVITTGIAPSVTTQISHLEKNVTVVENREVLAEVAIKAVNVMTVEVVTIVEITAEITSNMETMIGIVRSVTILIFHSVQNVIAVANLEALAEVEVMTVANVMTEEAGTIEEMTVEVVIIAVAVMTEEANEGHVRMTNNGLVMIEEWELEIRLKANLNPKLNLSSKKDQEIIEGEEKKGLVEMIDVLAIE